MGDPPPHSATPPLSLDDEIEQLLLDTVASPAERQQVHKPQHSLGRSPPKNNTQNNTGSRSLSPSPVWCQGCGMQEPDGDNDPEEVQCQQCKLWAHIKCLAADVDWKNPKVEFICRRCNDPLVDLYAPLI
jgi:hypothetical protein